MRQLSDIIWRQHPLTLPPTATVQEGCALMAERQVGAILVTDDSGRLVGIFTARDGTNRVLAKGKDAKTTRLGDVMTSNPTTMTSKMTAVEAFKLMRKGGFRHVPVVDGGELKGVVSRGDFHAGEQYILDEELKLWDPID